MRRTLIILITIFLGCSTQQDQKGKTMSSDTLGRRKGETSKLILTTTNNCDQVNLSKQFDLSVDFKRYSDTIKQQDSCLLTVYIKNKLTKSTTDSFFITTSFYYSFIFSSCDSMTSYTTKFKSDRKIVDNYFGDIVVADLNFDGNDDIAVINDAGGNGGPSYTFYTQTNASRFLKDNFLTDSVEFFPSEINSKKKTLTTYVHAGACCVGEHIYQYGEAKNIWKQTSHKILGQGKK